MNSGGGANAGKEMNGMSGCREGSGSRGPWNILGFVLRTRLTIKQKHISVHCVPAFGGDIYKHEGQTQKPLLIQDALAHVA